MASPNSSCCLTVTRQPTPNSFCHSTSLRSEFLWCSPGPFRRHSRIFVLCVWCAVARLAARRHSIYVLSHPHAWAERHPKRQSTHIRSVTSICLLCLMFCLFVQDEVSSTMIGAHNYATQEMVNLALVGCAHSNVFDGEKKMDSAVLRGIPHR
jgi:hypothetical protein